MWARKQGYTIVEVMIVLAVSGALLASALLFMNGRSRRLAFENDITDFRTELDDVINNVSSGYYARSSDFQCSGASGVPSVSSSVSSRGTNADCQFLGRAVHVNKNWNNYYYIHNVIGLRKVDGKGSLVSSIAEAKPQLLSISSALSSSYQSGVETAEKVNVFNSKIGATKYFNFDNTAVIDKGFLGFISSFPNFTQGSSNPDPGAQSVSLYVYDNGQNLISLSVSKDSAVDAFPPVNPSFLKPIDKFQFCFDSLGSSQRGIITVGEDRNDLKTSQVIEAGSCSQWNV